MSAEPASAWAAAIARLHLTSQLAPRSIRRELSAARAGLLLSSRVAPPSRISSHAAAASDKARVAAWRRGAPELLVVAALLVGLGLRFVNLAGLPPALHQDEAVNGYDAYSLWLTGRDHNGHPFPFAGLESFGD